MFYEFTCKLLDLCLLILLIQFIVEKWSTIKTLCKLSMILMLSLYIVKMIPYELLGYTVVLFHWGMVLRFSRYIIQTYVPL